MINIKSLSTRSLYIASAIALAVAVVVPALLSNRADAAVLSGRSILLSSSVLSATSNYTATFSVPTAGNNAGIVIDFCSNSPIIGVACTAPTGFSVTSATAGTSTLGANSYTKSASSDANTFIFEDTSATSVSGAASLVITGATNPSSNGTLYARILTYTSEATANAYTSTVPGTYVDNGGVAMAINNQLNITSYVQEELTFCVFTTGTTCAGGSGNSITLGDTNGILSSTTPYINKSAYFSLYTNAASGVAVTQNGTTLTSGGNTITALTSPTASAVNTEQFGSCVDNTNGPLITPTANYTGGGSNCSTTAAPSTVGSTLFTFVPGSFTTIANATAGNEGRGQLAYMANVATTTEPGVYTTAITYVGTGTF